ncbi:MAG: hypothetical protein MI920_31860 [Kiloniellales bacterium]|nr:hypothetical protein [Kiloniellales bacterium]
MDRKLDSWVAARNLIDKYGETAAYDHAHKRAQVLQGKGQGDEAAIWRLVEAAILDLIGRGPGPGEPRR